jgi:LCP family protein required for cell wall assembly
VSLLIFIGYLLQISNPDNHFQQAKVPVLVSPTRTYVSDDTFPVLNWMQGSVASAATAAPLAPAVPANTTSSAAQQVEETPKKKQDEFNLLVVGTDARETEMSRADVIMVVHVIPLERRVNIVSIPRDTMVYISGTGYTKVNHAHILGELKGGNRGGTEELLQVVSNFLNIPINYYVKTNFQGFKDLVNAIGGVDVMVENTINLHSINVDLPAGLQHIDGELALGLVRERWAFPEGDFGRQKEQSKVLKGIAKKVLSPEHIMDLASTLAKVRKDLVDTNFSDSDLLSVARLFKGMSDEDFKYAQIPGGSVYQEDPLVHTSLYYWKPDMDQVKSMMNTFFLGN